jgi:hypothetical protein
MQRPVYLKVDLILLLFLLQCLYLRQNLIKKVEGLNSLGSTLRELELYDNQITKIENLDSLVNLE